MRGRSGGVREVSGRRGKGERPGISESGSRSFVSRSSARSRPSPFAPRPQPLVPHPFHPPPEFPRRPTPLELIYVREQRRVGPERREMLEQERPLALLP